MRYQLKQLLTVFVVFAILLTAWKKLVVPAQHAVKASLCHSNLFIIRHALILYNDANGTLPPAYMIDVDGKPVHSWRVLLLPYLDLWNSNFQTFHQAYDFNQPWNGPNNSSLTIPIEEYGFWCPCGTEQNTILTSYVVLIGPNTLFPGTQSASLSDMPNNSDPILVLEITNSDIQWPEPRDLNVDSLSTQTQKNSPRLAQSHAGRIRYITASGKLGVLPPGTSFNEIIKLAEFCKP